MEFIGNPTLLIGGVAGLIFGFCGLWASVKTAKLKMHEVRSQLGG
jgi:hypothetical protein